MCILRCRAARSRAKYKPRRELINNWPECQRSYEAGVAGSATVSPPKSGRGVVQPQPEARKHMRFCCTCQRDSRRNVVTCRAKL